MNKVVFAALIGVALLAVALTLRLVFRGRWRIGHQRLLGATTLAYGAYLALLTGTVTQFVVPGIGAIGAGAVTGSLIGLATFAVLGVIGVATGGTAFAVGAGLMALVGGTVGAAGGAAGGFGFRTVSVPLVSPFFWVPVLILGAYWLIGFRRKR
jgi:hypothetical protein